MRKITGLFSVLRIFNVLKDKTLVEVRCICRHTFKTMICSCCKGFVFYSGIETFIFLIAVLASSQK